jgi:hypothetical protein
VAVHLVPKLAPKRRLFTVLQDCRRLPVSFDLASSSGESHDLLILIDCPVYFADDTDGRRMGAVRFD